MEDAADVSFWGGLGDAIAWFFVNLGSAISGLFYVITHPVAVLNFSDGEALMRFIYYGASTELFFAFLLLFVIFFAVGIARNDFLWGVVRTLEGISNIVGRTAAWAGLAMVLQQIMVVFLQAIFRVSDISVGPFGLDLTMPLGWYADGLKFHNALVVTLCCAYTFVQGGHVRVDLVYAAVGHRTKRMIDMFGCIFFMLPAMLITWFYSWFFLWRHLITPKVSASDPLDRMILKARALRWNVETIGFSPNGFNGYFLFKVLLVAFCFLMILQAVAFFFRSYLEYVEGEESAGKYLDLDQFESSGDPKADKLLQEGH